MPSSFNQIPGHEWAAIVFVGVWAVTFLGIHIRWSRRNNRVLLDPVFGLAAVTVSLIPAAVAWLVTVLALTSGVGTLAAEIPDELLTLGNRLAAGDGFAVFLSLILIFAFVGVGLYFIVAEVAINARAAEDVRRANPKIVADKRLYGERTRARAAEIRGEQAAARY